MSHNVATLHSQLIAYLKQGKFAEGIEDFYAEDASAQENTKALTVSQATMVTNERAFLTKVTAYHGIDVLATAIDDQGGGTGTVFYEAVIQ